MHEHTADLARAPGQRFILAVPEAPSAVVLIIGGSGPTSASGPEVRQGVGVYDLWAEEMSRAGLAVARSDKATLRSREVAQAVTSLADEYCEDIMLCERAAMNRLPGAKIVGVAHSLGSVAALRCVAVRRLSGLVAVSPPVLPVLAMMLQQMKMAGLQREPGFAELSALSGLAEIPAGRTAGVSNSYWNDLRRTTLADALNTRPASLPMLVLTGGRDALVPDESAYRQTMERLREQHAGEPVTWRHLENADHGLLVDGSADEFGQVVVGWIAGVLPEAR